MRVFIASGENFRWKSSGERILKIGQRYCQTYVYTSTHSVYDTCSGRITWGPEEAWPPEWPGGPLETSGL